MTRAGPGLDKLKMPGPGLGPGRVGIFFIVGAGPEFIFFFIARAEVGPGLKILK